MEQWQDVASQQVKLVTTRLSELLSRGQLWIRTELGVDLGLSPELIPPWVLLLAACTGLVLMVLLWASLFRAVFKKQPTIKAVDDPAGEVKRGSKLAKEEPKKKKKKSEKKSQPNGRAVVEPQEEEAVVSEEVVPHHHQPPPPEVKTEKITEVKKSKKKAKQAAKEPTKIVTTEGKEPEEGTWETKVSNKEKREQRKKDKGSSDGSSSPGGGDSRITTATEQQKVSAAAPPANQKKKKGGEVKPEKIEADVANVPVKTEPAAAPVHKAEVKKVPPQTVDSKTVNWTSKREPASLWGSEIDGSWTVIDRSTLGTFTGLGMPSAEPKSMSQLPWLNQPAVDDEWSGINGGGIDCNSDWNAPAEVWGNYEEPAPDPVPVEEPSVQEPDKNNLLIEAANDDDEKDKEDTSGDGAAKGKKKKKKKKKAAEEGATAGQGEEPDKEAPVSSVKQLPPVQEIPASVQTLRLAANEVKAERNMKENVPVTQVPQKPATVEPTAKSVPASTQQKPESQAPKPAKKKKVRRET
ncbi:protein LYRIC-like [Eucyclogobius newberryi]|uniref:protein LYRIC-like n=1 Tax=Eucyclogobius newberryi TaxID=166745 RepID=UPI003B5AF3D1